MKKIKERLLSHTLKLSLLLIPGISQLSYAAAEMYRENAPQVHSTKGGVIAVAKSLSPLGAVCPSVRAPRYILSEKGMGVKPLVLSGMPIEILEALSKCPNGMIENQSEILPNIYMGIVRFRPGKGWKGLFPMQDFMQQFVEQVTKIGGQVIPTVDSVGHTLNDVVGDFIEWLKARKMQGKNNTLKKPNNPEKVYVKFSYIQEEGMEKIGYKSVMFREILKKLYLHLKPLPPLPKNKIQN